jgi:hypothetical protein
MKRKSRYQLINPSHKDKVAPAEIDLLHTRTLLCVRNFTHYKGGKEAIVSVECLFRDYKKHSKEIKENVKKAFAHLRESTDRTPAEIEAGIKEATRVINEVAKKYKVS